MVDMRTRLVRVAMTLSSLAAIVVTAGASLSGF
jgi:hypothetical protein